MKSVALRGAGRVAGLVIVVAGLSGAAMAQPSGRAFVPQPAYRMGDTDRLLATPRPYPANRVDSVRRPGFNGRLWRGETFTNQAMYTPVDSGNPGADLYGAVDEEGQLAFVRTGNSVISISPWDRWEGESFPSIERARGQWLKERGYTGGVRTHVNAMHHPVYSASPAVDGASDESHASANAKEITPRATIEIPADMPRFKSRMQVDAGRISRPFGLPSGTVAKVITSDRAEEAAVAEAPADGLATDGAKSVASAG
ncbi:MAG: hypothetical protein RBS39_09320 [Phycisphaerales bacterium]|jgi:hypothetical protein|nr:hypothetical protein [Phycisphaerales bacterium]